ncbi:MAG: SPOR domain-containing protein [Treponema sp.]|jgi:DedD protein|nr:SPOR domain-containing protein [Treponema sp.]
MEKKKIILVAVSVGVFLVIAISAAILIVAPKTSGTAVAAVRPVSPGLPRDYRTPEAASRPDSRIPGEGAQPASVDAVDMVRNADGIQGIQSPPQATAIQENHFYINGENAEDSYRVEANNMEASPSRVVINVPKPTTAAVPDVPVPARTETAAAGNRARAAAPARETAAPAASGAGSARTGSAPAGNAKAGNAAAKTPAAASSAYRDYWVQAGAFSAKIRAEGAREILASKGITSIIENRVVDGKTWYRVRVGPYTSENEANYWLSLVKTIDGFTESQVRLTGAPR